MLLRQGQDVWSSVDSKMATERERGRIRTFAEFG